jgi:hypothetical protein
LISHPACSASLSPLRAADVPAAHVVYIGGSGRSGSTLLERILGQFPGVCAVGEVVHLWERGVAADELCGCGATFRGCDFWSEVGSRAFGGWDSLDVERILSLHRAVIRHRFIPLMAAPWTWPRFDRKLRAYRSLQARLYRGIREASGCPVIVDSSKNAAHAFVLSGASGVKTSLLHLVRDSRGVAYSWMKRVVRPEVAGAVVYMPRYSPARAAAEWGVDNILFQLLGRMTASYEIVRYETLARRPRAVVHRILQLVDAGGSDADLAFIGQNDIELRMTHSVAGNPMRFRTGPVAIHLDEEWREHMRWSDRLLVAAITWPLLAWYGYGGRS